MRHEFAQDLEIKRALIALITGTILHAVTTSHYMLFCFHNILFARRGVAVHFARFVPI